MRLMAATDPTCSSTTSTRRSSPTTIGITSRSCACATATRSLCPTAPADGAVPGSGPTVDPAGEVTLVERSSPAITVAFAPVKGDRPEWVVQKLTELGVDRIVADARRSGRSCDGKASGRQPRRRACGGSAARRRCSRASATCPRSSRRLRSPRHRPSEARASPTATARRHDLDRPVVLVGPEGGWSDRELAAEVPHVRLSASVLRSETAAVAAGVLLTALRSALVGRHVG